MSMRLRGSKTDLESAGLDTEGMATSVSKLRDELISLTGVDIMENEDTFKSSYDILIGIGEVWDQLSDINQANVTELLFGKRQNFALVYRNIYCKTHLIAGNALELCTTITEKSCYDGLTTQRLAAQQRSS